MRRNDVASTSFRRRVPIRFLINQCQIITFLILKYDIIENSRIELRGIVLPVQMGGLLGGAKGYVGPPSQIIGGAWPPLAPPLPTPMMQNRCRSRTTKHISIYYLSFLIKQKQNYFRHGYLKEKNNFLLSTPVLKLYKFRLSNRCMTDIRQNPSTMKERSRWFSNILMSMAFCFSYYPKLETGP